MLLAGTIKTLNISSPSSTNRDLTSVESAKSSCARPFKRTYGVMNSSVPLHVTMACCRAGMQSSQRQSAMHAPRKTKENNFREVTHKMILIKPDNQEEDWICLVKVKPRLVFLWSLPTLEIEEYTNCWAFCDRCYAIQIAWVKFALGRG